MRGGKRLGAGRKVGSKDRRPRPAKRRRKPRAQTVSAQVRPVLARAAAQKPALPPALLVIDGGSGVPPEPDWSSLFADELDLAVAHERWHAIVRELRDTEKLANVNAHQIKRLVESYVFNEIATRHVAEDGAVFPRKGRKQPAYNPWFSVWKDTNAVASAIEAELTLTPRRRNNGGKVPKKAARLAASDEFLKPVAK